MSSLTWRRRPAVSEAGTAVGSRLPRFAGSNLLGKYLIEINRENIVFEFLGVV
jgi:hypothetical protein